MENSEMKKSKKRILVLGVLVAIFVLVIAGGVIGYYQYQKQNQELKEVVFSTNFLRLVGQSPEQEFRNGEETNLNHKYYEYAKINDDGTLSNFVTPRQSDANVKLCRKYLKESIEEAKELGVRITVNEEDASMVYYIPKDIDMMDASEMMVMTLPYAIVIQLYEYDRDTVRTEFRTETDKLIEEANVPNESFNITTEELKQ